MLALAGIERQHDVVLAALSLYADESRAKRVTLPDGVSPADVGDAIQNLEATYVIRLCAEFEDRLRQFWTATVRQNHPPMEVLLDRVAARVSVRSPELERAHRVRKYRNSLVHGGTVDVVTLQEARSYLCKYLESLPREW